VKPLQQLPRVVHAFKCTTAVLATPVADAQQARRPAGNRDAARRV
jgi:hypothetical protein